MPLSITVLRFYQKVFLGVCVWESFDGRKLIFCYLTVVKYKKYKSVKRKKTFVTVHLFPIWGYEDCEYCMGGSAVFCNRALSQNEIILAQTICGTADDAIIEQKTCLLVRLVPTDKSNKKKIFFATPNGHFFPLLHSDQTGGFFCPCNFLPSSQWRGGTADTATERDETLVWRKKLRGRRLELQWNRSLISYPCTRSYTGLYTR